MGEKKTYPPVCMKPGEVKLLSAQDGEIEFHAVYSESLLAFLVAFLKWKQLTEAPMQPSAASIEAAMRQTQRAWGQLDSYTMKKVMEKLEEGGIWLPDGQQGGSHA